MTPEYVELQIHLPADAELRRSTAIREAVSRTLRDHGDGPIAPVLWHRDPATNTPSGDLPLVRWSGGKRGDLIRISAIGEAGDALRQDGHRITRALARSYGKPLQENWSTGPCEAIEKPYATHFHIPMLLVTRSHRSAARRRVTYDATELPDVIRRTVTRGIERQGDRLGLDLPDVIAGDVSWGGHNHEPKLIRPWPDRPKDFALAVFGVEIDLNVRLEGRWAAGYLQSHGYGRILLGRKDKKRAA